MQKELAAENIWNPVYQTDFVLSYHLSHLVNATQLWYLLDLSFGVRLVLILKHLSTNIIFEHPVFGAVENNNLRTLPG